MISKKEARKKKLEKFSFDLITKTVLCSCAENIVLNLLPINLFDKEEYFLDKVNIIKGNIKEIWVRDSCNKLFHKEHEALNCEC